MVSRTSLRRVSSNSSNFSADSHSSQSTSSTAGRLSSETSTRPPSTFTTCICSVLTRKFRSLPQFGQVNVTYDSLAFRFYEMVRADAMQIGPKFANHRENRLNLLDFDQDDDALRFVSGAHGSPRPALDRLDQPRRQRQAGPLGRARRR